MNKDISETHRAVYLTAEDLRIVASLIYNAYHDDPWFREVLYDGNETQYEKKLRAAIREELAELWRQEQTFVGLFEKDRLVGAVCVTSQQKALGDSRYWNWRFKMLISIGIQSTRSMMAKENGILEHLPASNCGVIQFICIAPSEQKKGLSHLLLNAITLWCDDEDELEGIAVFTYKNPHYQLFSQHNFVQISEINTADIHGQLMFYSNLSK